ncbi:MAG: phosphatase PAP2 family protein [Solirubrobacterales bacterium]
MSRPLIAIGRRLPHGWRDLLLQLALFFGAYQGYQVVRGLSEGRELLALANAERIIEIERALGLYFEPGLQSLALDLGWAVDAANWMYVNSHFVITTGFLAWLYLRHNDQFYFVRNVVMVAMGIALTGYLLVPTAPPRLVPGDGLINTIAPFTSVDQDNKAVGLLVNKYAAVPSMHIGFSLMVAVSAMLLVEARWARALWALYPLLVFSAIVITGNHFWLDAAAGAAVAVVSALVAHRLLAPVRPGAWAFRDAPA